MSTPLYFDEIEVGNTWTSESRTVTETDVVLFSGLTGDFNRLHVDHHYAKQTAFGRPIAHGLLGVAWVAGLGSQSPNMRTEAFLGIRDWRFLKPLLIGDTVLVFTEVAEKLDSSRRRGTVVWKRDLRRHDDLVLQSGYFESLVTKRPRAES
ncbi:MAG TPA: MaoC/PaaZ C-terminal domain-containing protein [Pirellulaceae bacterium]